MIIISVHESKFLQDDILFQHSSSSFMREGLLEE